MVNNEANNTPDNTALNEERLEPTDKKTNTDESISSIYIEDQCTLDLGAVGKGIACDVAQNYLKQQKEVSGAVIAVGGSILLYGSKVDGTNWNVAVQNPRGKDGEAWESCPSLAQPTFPHQETTKSTSCKTEKDTTTS